MPASLLWRPWLQSSALGGGEAGFLSKGFSGHTVEPVIGTFAEERSLVLIMTDEAELRASPLLELPGSGRKEAECICWNTTSKL